MAYSVTLQTNKKKIKHSHEVDKELVHDIGNKNGYSNPILSGKNPLKELDFLPSSLALLRCLCSFDSTEAFQKENLAFSEIQFTKILNFTTNFVGEGNSDGSTIVNLGKYVESPSSLVVTTEIREETLLPSLNQDKLTEDILAQSSSSPSLSSVISTKSQEPSISDGLVATDNCQSEQTRNLKSNGELCDLALIIDEARENTHVEEGVDDLAREIDIWGPPDEDEYRINNRTFEKDQLNSDSPTSTLSPCLNSEHRLAGIHAAAALFRRPSAASKKYTRAPISKIFISLDITAEMFLKLQSAAKVYMLDERFPERRKAIGSKSRSEKDLNKLKLYSLVKHFLEEEGWGERCFSFVGEEANQRKLKWPDSKKKIIKLVTPLMRRMVTNERQRRYAKEIRMEKRLGNRNKRENTTKSTVISSKPVETEIIFCSSKNQETQIGESCSQLQAAPSNSFNLNSNTIPEVSSNSNLDANTAPSLNPNSDAGPNADLNSNLDAIVEYLASSSKKKSLHESQESDIASTEQIKTLDKPYMKYYINLLQDGCRIKERLEVAPDQQLSFSKLIHYVNQFIDCLQEKIMNIKVHGPDGLAEVFDEDSWAQAIFLIFKHQWMDQEVRCLVNLEKST